MPTPTRNNTLIAIPVTEREYADWIAAHPHGFVINAHKTQSGKMLWHRADCQHIQPEWADHWVTGRTIKACSLNPGALAEWATAQGEALAYCQTCRDKWRGEQ